MVKLHCGRSCSRRWYGQTRLSIHSCLQMAAVSAVYTRLALHNEGSRRLSCGSDYAFSGPAFLLVSLEFKLHLLVLDLGECWYPSFVALSVSLTTSGLGNDGLSFTPRVGKLVRRCRPLISWDGLHPVAAITVSLYIIRASHGSSSFDGAFSPWSLAGGGWT